jgi:hypothetical protein
MGSCIQIKFNKIKNIQTYVYGGPSRSEATISQIDGNMQPMVGDTILIHVENGAIITALPNDGATETEFEFEWEVIKTPANSAPLIIGIVVGVVAVLIILGAVMKIRKNK